jgi:hypothetical protein
MHRLKTRRSAVVGGSSHQYTILVRLCGKGRVSSAAAIALVTRMYASRAALSLRVARTVTALRAEMRKRRMDHPRRTAAFSKAGGCETTPVCPARRQSVTLEKSFCLLLHAVAVSAMTSVATRCEVRPIAWSLPNSTMKLSRRARDTRHLG